MSESQDQDIEMGIADATTSATASALPTTAKEKTGRLYEYVNLPPNKNKSEEFMEKANVWYRSFQKDMLTLGETGESLSEMIHKKLSTKPAYATI